MMKTYLILFVLCIQATVAFAELHTPDEYLTVPDALFKQGLDTQRARARAALQEPQPLPQTQEPAVVQAAPQEGLYLPDVVYPSYLDYQRSIWQMQQQQAMMRQQAAWQQYWQQQAAMQVAAYYPPEPVIFVDPKATQQPSPQPTPEPTPAVVVESKVETHIVLETEHSKTEAQLPAAMTKEQQETIEKLTDYHTRLEAQQAELDAQRQEFAHYQVIFVMAVVVTIPLLIVARWSSIRAIHELRAFLAERRAQKIARIKASRQELEAAERLINHE